MERALSAPAAADAASGCLRDRGGCPAAPSAPEPCPEGLSAQPLSGILASPDRWVGEAVAVRGPLVRSNARWCTLVYCVNIECCNTCWAKLSLGDLDEPGGKSLALHNARSPDLLTCSGDESLLCCALEAQGQEVVVRGTLRRIPAIDPDSAPSYALEDATVCAP